MKQLQRFYIITLITIFALLSGCDFVTTKLIERNVSNMITQYCASADVERRAVLIAKIRVYIPAWPDDGICPFVRPEPIKYIIV